MTKTEMQVMEFFWETGKSYTFAELQKYFTEKKGWKKQTLNTYLRNLHMKEFIKKELIDRKTVYTEISRKEYEQKKAEDFLQKNYKGKLHNFLAALTGKNIVTKDDEKELLRYLEEEKDGKL